MTSYLLLVLISLFVVTSHAAVTSQKHVTWKPAGWLKDLEPGSGTLQVQEIVNAATAILKQDLREEMRQEFSLQLKNEVNKLHAKVRQENQKIVQEINVKLAQLDRKISDVETNDLKSQVISLTNLHSREAKDAKENIYKDLQQLNNSLAELATKHGKYDAFNKEIVIKHKELELFHVQIKNQSAENHQQILENIRTLTEDSKASTLEGKKTLELFKTGIEKTIREQQQELVSLVDKLKQEMVIQNAIVSGGEENNTASLSKTSSLPMVQLGGRFYHFSTNKLSWPAAQTFCRSHGLELATLETEEENRLVVAHRNKVVPGHLNMWIGGTDAEGGGWRWSGSELPLSFSNWHRTRKDGKFSPNNHCLGVHKSDVTGGTWCDWNCGNENYYVCEGAEPV